MLQFLRRAQIYVHAGVFVHELSLDRAPVKAKNSDDISVSVSCENGKPRFHLSSEPRFCERLTQTFGLLLPLKHLFTDEKPALLQELLIP